LRAADLYSGVGGWSLGLRLANLDVAASYEKWDAANLTNRLNNGHLTHKADIRKLEPRELPSGVEVVVGSPPCTEFSFSNRGGGGDIKDGLRDIIKFLEIVDHLKPRWWVMENVPRVASIVKKELQPRKRLARFRHLSPGIAVFNMEDFGVPQRRRRCLIGNIDFELLRSYTGAVPARTLGDVISALSASTVRDPLYGIELPAASLNDHDPEPHLDPEELRINKAGKLTHPVYNSMAFPDPLNRSVRTITATCTRVSRESVVIEDPARPGCLRRLTPRERASLQTFPITYEFYGETYAQKLRMIGNAVPPAFSFLVGHAIQGTPVSELPDLSGFAADLPRPTQEPPKTPPEGNARKFPPNRTFRFAVPNLRLKSGVRFEMANENWGGETRWAVRFVFGTSKDILDVGLGQELLGLLQALLHSTLAASVNAELDVLRQSLCACDLKRMQAVWSHSGPGGTRPFDVLDAIGATGAAVLRLLKEGPEEGCKAAVMAALEFDYGPSATEMTGCNKLLRHAELVHAGMLVGATANQVFLGLPTLAVPDGLRASG